MTRDDAIALAREHAKRLPESYYAEPFEPHEWVVQAILDAASGFQMEDLPGLPKDQP